MSAAPETAQAQRNRLKSRPPPRQPHDHAFTYRCRRVSAGASVLEARASVRAKNSSFSVRVHMDGLHALSARRRVLVGTHWSAHSRSAVAHSLALKVSAAGSQAGHSGPLGNESEVGSR